MTISSEVKQFSLVYQKTLFLDHSSVLSYKQSLSQKNNSPNQKQPPLNEFEMLSRIKGGDFPVIDAELFLSEQLWGSLCVVYSSDLFLIGLLNALCSQVTLACFYTNKPEFEEMGNVV